MKIRTCFQTLAFVIGLTSCASQQPQVTSAQPSSETPVQGIYRLIKIIPADLTGPGNGQRIEAVGTGVVISQKKKQFLLTAEHVFATGKKIAFLEKEDGNETKRYRIRRIIGMMNLEQDLAIYALPPEFPHDAPSFNLAESPSSIGSQVLAVGFPLSNKEMPVNAAQETRMTEIIRNPSPSDKRLCIKAPLPHGWSGGPIFNQANQVEGIIRGFTRSHDGIPAYGSATKLSDIRALFAKLPE